jgi:hypothetical protein
MTPDAAAPSQSTEPASPERFRLADYCFLAFLFFCCLLSAWVDAKGWKGDAIAYYDLSTAIRQHQWHAIFNASWAPLYPALMTIAQSVFHFDPMYAAASTRLLNAALGLAFCVCSYFMALAIRRSLLRSSVSAATLISNRSLMVLVTAFTFFLWSQDMGGERPDTLLSCFLLLTVGCLLNGLTTGSWVPFLVAGFTAGCAYWTKAFAFPYIGLLIASFMLTHWKQKRKLIQLATAGLIFGAVCAPYVAHISANKHRLTIGDAGRLNSAWYVNGGERLDPVADPAFHAPGNAAGKLLHPAELILKLPEIAYYTPGKVFGAMPAWDDFSYWSDGLVPRSSLSQSIRALLFGIKTLLGAVPMRLQLTALFLVLWAFGWRCHWSRMTPALMALAASSAISVGAYLLVHFEIRYVVFVLVILAGVLVLTASPNPPDVDQPRLHRALLVVAFLILLGESQSCMHASQVMPVGDQIRGRFNVSEYNMGNVIRTRFGPKAQMACMGMGACYDDSLWAWYGDAVVSAAITLPHGENTANSQQICDKIVEEKASTLEVLRARRIRAVVAYFEPGGACSKDWEPIPEAPGYYIMPTN